MSEENITKISAMPHSTSTKSSSGKGNSTKPSNTKTERDADRRRRNVESADRSRQRRAQQDRWNQLQVFETEERINELESEIKALSAELEAPPRRPLLSNRKTASDAKQKYHSDRPGWFGEPF